MRYYENNLYKEELKDIIKNCSTLSNLKNSTFVITGARGLIGSELIDAIMFANQYYELNCKVYGIVRNMEAAVKRFEKYKNSSFFQLMQADINKDKIEINENVDYLIHGASNTHPVYYSTKPIETILTNSVGTHNVLEFAVSHKCKKFIFLSSVEIYGENRGDVEKFTEDYLGYINSNTLRAGYPEGKRLGESLCQAYIHEKQMDCIIVRISRAFGAGLLKEDSKALSQFLNCALKKQNIILKSKGIQKYSYIYVADIIRAILFLAIKGIKGEAYNITGDNSDITLAELANYIANLTGTKVVFDIPDEIEVKGYSKATKALLDIEKIKELGWYPRFTIEEGIKRTLKMQKVNGD